VRPHGDRAIGADKGYTEALTDSDGERHGSGLGALLSTESDRLKTKNRRRAKIRSVAEKAAARGDHAKTDRIARNNLGTIKKTKARRRFEISARTLTFEAAHAITDKASTVAAEDLTRPFAARRNLGPNMNRRLAAWTKGLTAEALSSVSERRGSALVLVNAAYTSQVDPSTGTLGVRKGDKLYCESGDVWDADHAAAINILHRASDPDITLFTPHARVKQILQERADRQRARLPAQDSSPLKLRAESEISLNAQGAAGKQHQDLAGSLGQKQTAGSSRRISARKSAFYGRLGTSGKMALEFRDGTLSRVLLSDRDIRAELAIGCLRIDPLEDWQVQSASVDLRLGGGVRVIRPGRAPVNAAQPPEDLTARANPGKLGIRLRPGEFVLASTLERVTLPPYLAAQIDGKSTLGRLGVVVHSTAGWVDPGFDGQLTLEMSVAGPRVILFPAGMAVAQLCLFRCSSAAERPYGSPGLGSRYQHQQGPTAPRAAAE
jgi:deoxycytidine triphosphate deaminase